MAKCAKGAWRDQLAAACFTYAVAASDVSLVLYDVTNLLCRRRHNKVYPSSYVFRPHSARRVTLHLPGARPWQNAFTRLFADTHTLPVAVT